MSWLCVSIPVDDELSEPVSDILRRYAPDGVVLESTAIIDDDDSGFPAGFNLKGYIPLTDEIEDIKHRLLTDLGHLSLIQPIPDPVFETVMDEDWNARWKENYKPIPVGRSLLIQPAWIPLRPTSRKRILLDPGMAFGTGTHPTTRLCIVAIEDVIQPDAVVVDLGSGSGILSIAAILLGAESVLALDNDAEAVRAACENIEKNGMAGRIDVQAGSLPEALDFSTHSTPDLVVANILAKVLIRLLNEGLAGTLGEDSFLILSGILDNQVDQVLETAIQQGLEECGRLQERDWIALILKREHKTASD